MTTRINTELNAVINFAFANNAYSRNAIIECIRTSQIPELNTALDCCLDEGTLDEAVQFFKENSHVYH